MRPLGLWSTLLVAVVLVRPAPLSAVEPGPVEEWQVKGILAALEDGYPEVRRSARRKLAELLRPPHKAWNGKSHELTRKAVPELLLTVQDSRRERQPPGAAAAPAGVDFDRAEAASLLGQL